MVSTTAVDAGPPSARSDPAIVRAVLVFAVASAALFVLLGFALSRIVSSGIEQRALSDAELIGEVVADSIVDDLFTLADLESGGVDPERADELANQFEDGLDGLPVDRVKVFGADGTIVFSDEPALIGDNRGISPKVAAALDGDMVSELERAQDNQHEFERSLGSLLEVFVPIERRTGDGQLSIVGVYEVYMPYGETEASIAADIARVRWAIAIGMLLVWLGLLPLERSIATRLKDGARHRWLAHHDGLTRLPNRLAFEHRVETGCGVPGADRTAAVMIIDLDRFKEVNDTHGHHVGDEVLITVSHRMASQLRAGDAVARLGGDEFAVFTAGLDGRGAHEIAHRLLGIVCTPIEVGDITVQVSASIGIAMAPDHGRTFDDLTRHADLAMYRAKAAGAGVVTYAPDIDGDHRERLLLTSELRAALDDDQLVLHYQPIVDLRSCETTAVEALVRWQHPQRGLLYPDEFISLLEDGDLSAALARHVVRRALTDLATWRCEFPGLRVAVNVTPGDLLEPSLVDDVVASHRAAGLPTDDALDLEIVETTEISDPERTRATLLALRELGVGIAVDDYGSGYSSLGSLQSMPVSAVKIDRSFVMSLDANANDAIIRSTIALSQDLQLDVVAEGVETEVAFDILSRLGCHAAQGYWLARPTTADDVTTVCAALNRRLQGKRTSLPA